MKKTRLLKSSLKRREATIKDTESFFRNQIDSMLVTASWVETVKQTIGLKAVSQVWGDKPAWYFWVANVPGAYSLQLERTATEKMGNGRWDNGIFAVKYYPVAHEDVFKNFSFQEQGFIQSIFFDDTHTPRYESKEKIPATLFNVATVEYRTGPDGGPILFSLASLDAMRISFEQQTFQKYPLIDKHKQFRSGETDRNVPGWQLGFPLFDRLLSLYSFYSKKKPARVVLTRSAGFEYVFEKNQTLQCVDAADLNIYALNVLFIAEDEEIDAASKDLIKQHCSDEGQKVVYDRAFRCGHIHKETDSFPASIPLNEHWWGLAESDFKSELASTCGCA